VARYGVGATAVTAGVAAVEVVEAAGAPLGWPPVLPMEVL